MRILEKKKRAASISHSQKTNDIIYVQKNYNPLAFSRLHEMLEQQNNKKTVMPRPNLNVTSRNVLI